MKRTLLLLILLAISYSNLAQPVIKKSGRSADDTESWKSFAARMKNSTLIVCTDLFKDDEAVELTKQVKKHWKLTDVQYADYDNLNRFLKNPRFSVMIFLNRFDENSAYHNPSGYLLAIFPGDEKNTPSQLHKSASWTFEFPSKLEGKELVVEPYADILSLAVRNLQRQVEQDLKGNEANVYSSVTGEYYNGGKDRLADKIILIAEEQVTEAGSTFSSFVMAKNLKVPESQIVRTSREVIIKAIEEKSDVAIVTSMNSEGEFTLYDAATADLLARNRCTTLFAKNP